MDRLRRMVRQKRDFGICAAAVLAWACFLPVSCMAEQEQDAEEKKRSQGRYLVHRVAMCVECHSPRDASGRLVEGRLLTGGTIPAELRIPNQPWALSPPRLAGLPGWDGEEIEYLLRNGERTDSTSPRPPMPRFRMKKGDAAAVVSYLMSLR